MKKLFIILFSLTLSVIWSESENYVDSIYVIGDAELERQIQQAKDESFGELSGAEIAGMKVGFEQELKKMNLKIVLNKNKEIVFSMSGSEFSSEYRIRDRVLEILNIQSSTWMPLGYFNKNYSILELSANGTLLELPKTEEVIQYSVLEGKYTFGNSEVERQVEQKKIESFYDISETELEGYRLGVKQGLSELNFQFIFNLDSELYMNMSGENQGPIDYRLNNKILEIYQEDNDIWTEFGIFNANYTQLVLTFLNGYILEYNPN